LVFGVMDRRGEFGLVTCCGCQVLLLIDRLALTPARYACQRLSATAEQLPASKPLASAEQASEARSRLSCR